MKRSLFFSQTVLAFIAVFSIWSTGGWAQVSPAGQPSTSEWKMAAVFHRDGKRRTYLGRVELPTIAVSLLPAAPSSRLVGTAATGAVDFDTEIWLARDGASRGLWYSTARHAFGSLYGSKPLLPEVKDDGTLAEILRAARPAPLQVAPLLPHGEACYSWILPKTLTGLSGVSEVIAVGRVAGILRQAHSPMNDPQGSMHTVFLFAVERYIKSNDPGQPYFLKVFINGAAIPVTMNGQTTFDAWGTRDDPLLNVGDRYLLFLKFPPNHELCSPGEYIGGMDHGITGKIGEFDEYIVSHPWIGKVLLRDGRAYPPNEPVRDWSNLTGIFGQAEDELTGDVEDKLVQIRIDQQRRDDDMRAHGFLK